MIRTYPLALAAVCLGLSLFCASARAQITSGSIVYGPAPTNVGLAGTADATTLFAFAEQQNVTPAAPLNVNLAAPTTFPGAMVAGNATAAATIAAGTALNSFMLYSNNPAATGTVTYSGTITFNAPIVGVIFTSSLLDATDTQFGLAGTTYPTGDTARGLESADEFVQYISSNTLFVRFTTAGNVDQVRVFTTVPEPSALALCGAAGLTGAVFGLRRLRRRS